MSRYPFGSIFQRAEHAFIAAIGGQHQDAGIRKLTTYGHDGSAAVEFRHGQVHQGDIRFQLAESFHGLAAILRMAHHCHIRLEFQHRRQPVTDHGMVVGDQNPNRFRHSAR